MSYDLYLKPKKENFLKENFKTYFSEIENYRFEDNQAWYENETTGVYFSFEFQDKHDFNEEEEYYPIIFNMIFFRPSYFALEAEPEVSAFINKFSMTVDDPQNHGMGKGEYNSDKFLEGWSYGNNFAYKAILKDYPDVITLPQKQLHKAWEWNYKSHLLQETVTDDVFVPHILFLKYKNTPVSAAVWPDAIPSIIPPVDILLIERNNEDIAIGLWNEFQPYLEKHKKKMHGEAYYLYYKTVPKEIFEAINFLAPSDGEIEGISYDSILDRETVEKYVP